MWLRRFQGSRISRVGFRRPSPSVIGRLLRGILGVAVAFSGLAQDFNETRFRDGLEAYRSGRPGDAINPLRVAAFGFLGRPPEMCQSLFYLALAQDAAGRRADAQATVARLADVERRVPACAQAEIDAPTRAAFQARFGRPVSGSPPPAPPPPSRAATQNPAPETTASPGLDSSEGGVLPPERSAEDSNPDVLPRVVKSYPVVYPRAVREARLGGTVLVRVLVSETGRPLRVEGMRGPRPLTEAAIASIRRWTFEPGRKNGIEVQSWAVVAVPFEP